MKKILYLTILILSLPMIIFTQTINVHTHDGGVHNYTLSEIDSITFTVPNSGVFECGNPITYQNKTYNTVQIGDQCWFRENLDVGTMIESNDSSDHQTDNSIIEKYCYDNDESKCNTYGGLYQWNETMQYVTTEGTQGVCPSEWHIPTYSEMQTLQTYVENQAVKLIDESQAMNGYTPTNETSFSALFAGGRDNRDGSFAGLSGGTTFWSSTEENDSHAYSMYLLYNSPSVGFVHYYKCPGFSVRCLKD